MNISFQGYMENEATFLAAGTLTPGHPVTVSGNGTVAESKAGELFAGVVKRQEDGYAAVQTHGFVTLGYDADNAPTLGMCGLAAAGSGLVKKLASGRMALVVSLDATAKTAGIIL